LTPKEHHFGDERSSPAIRIRFYILTYFATTKYVNLNTYDAVAEALLWRLWYPLSNGEGIVILAGNTLRAPNNGLTDIVREFAIEKEQRLR